MQMSTSLKLNRAASLAVVAMLISAADGQPFSSGSSMMELLKNCNTNEERERLIQEWRALPPRNEFFGQVVDMQGNPIPDATVNLSWHTLFIRGVSKTSSLKETLKTDKNGCFKKKCSYVGSFYAYVSKDGYEEVLADRPGNFLDHPWHSEENPVITVLRKRGPLTFLIVSPSSGQWTDIIFGSDGTNSVSRPFDLLSWDSSRKWRDSATINADLRIDAAFDVTEQCWNVTYSITNGPGGIVLSNEMLYEAPADGYAPSVSTTFTDGRKQQKYLYVKSRMPAVYSRVMFVHGASVGGEVPYLNVACTAWVNPYGERGLEFDERIDSAFFLADTLKKEALEAFASGRYPEKPKDMGTLAKETRERVLREQEERNRREKEWQAEQEKLKEAKKK